MIVGLISKRLGKRTSALNKEKQATMIFSEETKLNYILIKKNMKMRMYMKQSKTYNVNCKFSGGCYERFRMTSKAMMQES